MFTATVLEALATADVPAYYDDEEALLIAHSADVPQSRATFGEHVVIQPRNRDGSGYYAVAWEPDGLPDYTEIATVYEVVLRLTRPFSRAALSGLLSLVLTSRRDRSFSAATTTTNHKQPNWAYDPDIPLRPRSDISPVAPAVRRTKGPMELIHLVGAPTVNLPPAVTCHIGAMKWPVAWSTVTIHHR
ncbi:hypothetical protein [Streptomyces sp. ISL-100]|uniref:hypothetical protein n=1 Tax=Streptomyces sp. ISL-100 TaxID=2819173 RepID=UPI001BE6246E|nr:hypothetical protein [Streptomyces sp. ISL-100]MBT2396304.1 hypothetical protein [Streptomyces sp. ISL-100]